MSSDRRELRRQLFNIASQQGGYFTAAQAKDAGYSYQAQAHHAEVGNWQRSSRGLFRLSEWIPGLHDDLIRWMLWSKNRAVISHETAMAVYELGEFESPHIHLTVPPGFSMHDDAVVLHKQYLPQNDVVIEGALHVTTVVRSLIDIASVRADSDQLARAIYDARESGALTLRQLRERAEAVNLKAALHIEQAIQQMESA